MRFIKIKARGSEKNFIASINCSVSKASNEIMLDRISGGKDIEFPFCPLIKE